MDLDKLEINVNNDVINVDNINRVRDLQSTYDDGLLEDIKDLYNFDAMKAVKEIEEIKMCNILIEQNTIVGNIFDGNENIIVHQVNMHKKMGSGIAKQIRERFPKVYDRYLQYDGKLGDVDIISYKVVGIHEGTNNVYPIFFIANMYSQNDYGYDGQLYTNYDAMREGFRKIRNFIRENNYQCIPDITVAIPYKIGCGLGGGDWEIVSQIIVEELRDVEYKIYKLA